MELEKLFAKCKERGITLRMLGVFFDRTEMSVGNWKRGETEMEEENVRLLEDIAEGRILLDKDGNRATAVAIVQNTNGNNNNPIKVTLTGVDANTTVEIIISQRKP